MQHHTLDCTHPPELWTAPVEIAHQHSHSPFSIDACDSIRIPVSFSTIATKSFIVGDIVVE